MISTQEYIPLYSYKFGAFLITYHYPIAITEVDQVVPTLLFHNEI